MARKASTPPSERPLSRKHVSRAEREAEQRQRVIIGTTVVTILVALILAAGVISAVFIEPGQAMAKVGDETITREALYKRINYERFRIFQVFEDTRTQYIDAAQDPQTASFLGQFFQQQLSQLAQAYSAVGSQTLETMIEERIIEKEAASRNITVDDAAVDEEVRRQIARQEGAQIEPDVTATAEAAVAATATAELFTPTPTLEPSPTVEATEISGSDTVTPTVTAGPTFTPAPTATPNILTDDTFQEKYQAFLDEMKRRTSFTEADYRNVIRLQLLRTRLSDEYEAETDVATTEEQIHAAHILVATEDEAKQVIERLNEGETFEALASELSTDQSNAQQGGDLGWFGRGQMVEAFEEGAFALKEPGDISEPVQTQFGWHVIKLIEGPEERDIPEAQLEQERAQAFTTFLQDAKTAATVDRFWDIDDLPSDPFIDELQEPLPTTVPLPTSTRAPEGESTPAATETVESDE